MLKKIVTGGASITASPWFTWADFLENESGLARVDLSQKGVGNEFIINSLLKNHHHLGPDSLVVLMLTNIDKWDVFVQGARFDDLIDQKHPPISIGPRSGFWCTGSWFPDFKQNYYEQYYDVDYFCCRSIQMIILARMICQRFNSQLEIFYDSDIWNYTEQSLNAIVNGADRIPGRYLCKDLSKLWTSQLQTSDLELDTQSLIGFCWHHDLPWANQHYKGHPPSSSHWQFYQSVIRPRIVARCNLRDSSHMFAGKIEKMDQTWLGS